MPNNSVLKISKLSTSFLSNGRWNKVVKEVDLQLAQGEILAIVGESGSGKSITSLSILGLLPKGQGKIVDGEIFFDGKIDLAQLGEKELRSFRSKEISIVFQDPMTSLNPVEKCGKQVSEVIRLHLNKSKKEAQQDVIKLFEKVRLKHPEQIFHRYPFEISGGQKQRVMIAIAMACKPKLLIADEPTTALDPDVSKSILALIKEIQKENNMAVIFITHDLAILKGFADRIAVMRNGAIVESGISSEILTLPKEKYTKALLACRPPKSGKPLRLPTVDQIINGNYQAVEAIKYVPKEIILEVKELNTWYAVSAGLFGKSKAYIKAVNGVSFNIHKGESLGLIGSSGCGKSTLGRSLVGLEKIQSGHIFFGNKDQVGNRAKEWKQLRRNVQIIFQDPYSSLNPKISVGKALAEVLIAHGIQKTQKGAMAEVHEMLKLVGLKEADWNRYPHEFSGGQRQRIGIARSLILKPQIVICDESVSALDVSVQAQVLNLLNDLKEELGLTYLFISHDLDVVNYFCDRVLEMKNGKILCEEG